MTTQGQVVHLHDLDLLLEELRAPAARARLKKLGLACDEIERLESGRARLAGGLDRRWSSLYERARQRYGRAVAAVRDRVCLGCFVTLPTSAQPRPGDTDVLGVCESCARILYWG